jgi:hypothetical protein
MSRVDGRFTRTREATSPWALPHLQPTALPSAAVITPSYLWQPGPRRGGAVM